MSETTDHKAWEPLESTKTRWLSEFSILPPLRSLSISSPSLSLPALAWESPWTSLQKSHDKRYEERSFLAWESPWTSLK